MNKFLKTLVCLLSVCAIASCAPDSKDSVTSGNNDNPSVNTDTPSTDSSNETVNPDENESLTLTMNFVDPSDKTGAITGKIPHIGSRLVDVYNSTLTTPILKSISGDENQSEIKDVTSLEGVKNMLKLGGKSSSEISFTFNDNVLVKEVSITTRPYYNYVSYDSSWHNDTKAGLIIKNGDETKDVDLTSKLDGLPDSKVIDYTFTTPTKSFELWSKSFEGEGKTRTLIESIEINYEFIKE